VGAGVVGAEVVVVVVGAGVVGADVVVVGAGVVGAGVVGAGVVGAGVVGAGVVSVGAVVVGAGVVGAEVGGTAFAHTWRLCHPVNVPLATEITTATPAALGIDTDIFCWLVVSTVIFSDAEYSLLFTLARIPTKMFV